MIFKDRQDAGTKLLTPLSNIAKKNNKQLVILSLLRGGAVVGDVISKGLGARHLPLVVSKINAPQNEELAIGALCFDVYYLEKEVIDMLELAPSEIARQIKKARKKCMLYLKRFGLREEILGEAIRQNVAVVVDDGIATGSTMRAAINFVKSKKPAKVILAAPIAPADFTIKGVDNVIILKRSKDFKAVSQFYMHFPQMEDHEVKKYFKPD